VSGVLVLAVNINGTVVAYTSTLNDGSYSFDNLTGGEYQIIAEATEYENTAENGSVILDYGTNSSKTKDLYLTPASATKVESGSTPNSYALFQNYPNPFNPSTTIRFILPEKSKVSLEVYNLIGQKVATLINSELNAGEYNVEFNGSNLSSGIYLYKLQAGNFTSTKKMLLIK
ncbi:MAG: T9SS type A sorting domain-containing protein, partial [Ignavibacteria bacterium]|nr:T9SS type A sorting domain-containing protein [Ignavibacteria bacterium]